MTPTETKILFTLAMADQPLSIDDVSFRCGVSYNTVKRTVADNPRVTREGKYPVMLSLAKPKQLKELIAFDYVNRERPDEGWVAWLEEIRPLLPSIAALPDGMSVQEKQRKINMFNTLGTSFLSLAKDMEEEE
jgi:hypothetical protein